MTGEPRDLATVRRRPVKPTPSVRLHEVIAGPGCESFLASVRALEIEESRVDGYASVGRPAEICLRGWAVGKEVGKLSEPRQRSTTDRHAPARVELVAKEKTCGVIAVEKSPRPSSPYPQP